MAAPSPWERAWEQFEEENKGSVNFEVWRAFKKMDGDERKPENFIQQLKDVQSQVDEKYSPRFSRAVELLDLVRITGGQVVQYGPQTVGIAFTTFSFVFKFVTADKDLCDTISMTIENVIHWIFVGEIYTRRYSHEMEDPPTESKHQELATSTIDGTIDLFVLVLKICLEIFCLKLTHDPEATGEDRQDRNKSISWDRTKRHIKKSTQQATDSFGRHIVAFFGKGSELQGMLEEGKRKLATLHEHGGLRFQDIAESQLKILRKDIHDLPRRLHRALDPLQQSVNRVEWTTIETKATVERMERRLGQDEFKENFLWLQSGAVLPVTQPRDRQRELKPTAGTCDWIFRHEDYQSWKEGNTCVCWLFGEAGVGKSHVTSSVIEKLVEEDDKPLVLSFFCQTGSDSSSKVKQILLHLLVQLFQSCAVLESYEDRRECLEIIKRARFGQSGSEYREKVQKEEKKSKMMLMEEIQAAFIGLLKVFRKKVYIIVDAFDCIDIKPGGLVDALVETRTQKGQQNVFLWISSRPEDHPREVADKGLAEGRFSVVEMETGDNDDNIRTYLKAAFKEMSHIPNNRKDQAERVIIEQARGSFLRASTAINALSGEKAFFDITQALEDLPTDMNQSWQQKWESLSLYQRKQLSVALRWVLCACGPITTTFIADEIEKKYPHRLQKDYEPGESENKNAESQILQRDGGDDEKCGATAVMQQTERRSIKALKEFARDFLEFHAPDGVQLRSRDIRDWVLDDREKVDCKNPQHCSKCLGHMQSTSTTEFAPKQGSIQMALYVMRTINNKEFQKEHLFPPGTKNENFKMFMNDKMYSDSSAPLLDDQAKSSDMTQDQNGDQLAEAEKIDALSKGTISENDNVEDEAQCFASRASSEASELITAISDTQSVSEPPLDLDDDADFRYEAVYWGDHLRDAEDNWLPEERTSNEWTELYALAERFMNGRSPAFRGWVDRFLVYHGRLESYDLRLHVALGFGILGLMDRFVDQVDGMSQLPGFGTPLHLACHAPGGGRLTVDQLDRVFDKFADAVNVQENQEGETPVHALVSGDAPLEVIKLIVEKYRARIDIPTWKCYFPIHKAVSHPDAEVCRFLLGRPECSANAVDDEGETPLHWLLHEYNASPEIAKILIENGASVCASDNENQQPLYEAARTDNVDIGEMLLQHDACVDNIENTSKWTALHQAVSKGHVKFVKMLLRHDPGPDMSLEDKKLRTALHLAAKYGHQEILKTILKYSAGILQGKAEEAPADSNRGTQAHPHVEILRTEMDRSDKIKALLEKPDYRGNNPLHKAAACGHVDCTKLIFEYGNAKVLCSMQNNNGATPLQLAFQKLFDLELNLRVYSDGVLVHKGQQIRSCIHLLLENGADPNARDKDGKTPLCLAVDAKDFWSVQQLGMAGADPMQPVCHGNETTILQMITEPWREGGMATADDENDEELVKVLLRSSKKLPRDVCLNILNIALERRAVGVLKSFTARLDDKDQHGWSILALAVQFREGSLIDRILLPESESYFPKWSSVDKHKDILVSEDGTEVSCSASIAEPQDQGCGAVRADLPIPPGTDRYYYEIEIIECGSIGTLESVVGIGLASQFYTLYDIPGLEFPYQSWGYHGDDGHKYGNETKIKDGHAYGQGDTVGAGVDFAKQEIFFTKNGTRLGTSFSGESVKGKLFPTVGFYLRGVKIRANFGTREFKYRVE